MASRTNNTGAPAVSFEHVTKTYRGGGGVVDLNFTINRGEVFGLLGPNGAGKTTAIRLIIDLLRPNTGTVRVFGLDARRDGPTIRRTVGYIPGDLGLYPRLTAREILTHFAHLRGNVDWAVAERYATEFELELDRPVRALSKGNRQKIGLVAAFMGNPELLVLDEPTSGLDPFVQQLVHTVVRRAATEGRTVLLSSHILSEVAEMANRVGLIRSGRLMAVEDVQGLQRRSAHLVDVLLRRATDAQGFSEVAGVRSCTIDGRSVHLEVVGDFAPLLARLAPLTLDDLSIREPSLEELFLTFYSGRHE